MTPSPDSGAQPMGGSIGPQKRRFPRYHDTQPGNEPGGVNGQYGRFGQTPDQQPSMAFDSSIDAAKRGFSSATKPSPEQTGNNIGAIAKNLYGRYGQQGRMDRGVNKMQSQMRRQGMANGLDQMQAQPMSDEQHQQDNPYYQSGQYDADKAAYIAAHGDPSSSIGGPSGTPPGGMGGQQQAQTQPGGGGLQMPAMPDDSAAGSSIGAPSGIGRPSPQIPPSAPSPASPTPQSGFSSPFGKMNFGQPQAMADGAVVTEPTLAVLGEDGAEAVVPMSGNPNAKVTPGMVQPRDTFQTGPSSLGQPLHDLPPTSGPMAPRPKSTFGRYNA